MTWTALDGLIIASVTTLVIVLCFLLDIYTDINSEDDE